MTDNTNMPPPEGQKAPRKWPRVLLAVSLTANLLVLGLVIGANVSGHRDHGFDARGPERGSIRDLGFGPLAGALDRDDRRAIGKGLRDKSGSFADNRRQLSVEFQQMLEVLRAETFEPEKLEALMAGQSDRMRERGETLRGLVLERISSMSVKERRAFATRIEKSVQKRKRK